MKLDFRADQGIFGFGILKFVLLQTFCKNWMLDFKVANFEVCNCRKNIYAAEGTDRTKIARQFSHIRVKNSKT